MGIHLANLRLLDRFCVLLSFVFLLKKINNVEFRQMRCFIRHINNNKAPGSDDLNIELIKAIDDDSKMMAQLTHLCNQIITTGKWPAEFRGYIYVPIYKKGEKLTARTIELLHLSHMPARECWALSTRECRATVNKNSVRLNQASGKTTEHVTKS